MEIIVGKYLAALESKLFKNKQKQIELTRTWANTFPNSAGVYVLFEDRELVYAGETQSIRERMKDCLDTRNHTIRRKIGALNFSEVTGFEKANSKKKYPEHIETLVCDWMTNNNKISYVPVELGRKELEEYLILKYKPKYNSVGRRGKCLPCE